MNFVLQYKLIINPCCPACGRGHGTCLGYAIAREALNLFSACYYGYNNLTNEIA